jgi:phenylacetate-CoA ligase
MTPDFLESYLKKLKQFKISYIQAYPSAISIFARFILENEFNQLPPIRAILAGSENLYPSQRKLIENAFKCRVFSWYGHAEKAALAGECENNKYYHIFPEYGYLELLGKDGNKITNDREIGEIVVTGFNNFATPFIRYRTSDLGVFSKDKCTCGRQYQLLKRIEGRLQELIVSKTDRLISMTAINMHSNVFDNVRQFQFYQDKKGEIVLNLVKKKSYTQKDTECIKNELQKKLGNDMGLNFHFVENINRTKNGKYRFLIQKLPIKWTD